jgi:hypothetical protein
MEQSYGGESEMIESVSVLKAQVLLLFTEPVHQMVLSLLKTKDGSKKKGFAVSFNTSITMDSAFKLPQFQNEYGQGNSGQFAFVNGLGGGTNDNISY